MLKKDRILGPISRDSNSADAQTCDDLPGSQGALQQVVAQATP